MSSRDRFRPPNSANKPPVATRRSWRPFDYVRFQLLDIEDSHVARGCLFQLFVDEAVASSGRRVVVAVCLNLTTYNSFQFEELLGNWILEAINVFPHHHLELIATCAESGSDQEAKVCNIFLYRGR